MEGEVLAGKARTLQGCLVSVTDNELVIGRELQAVAELETTPGQHWDTRWTLGKCASDSPQAASSRVVKALGEGILHCPEWRETGYRRNTLMTSPALWIDGRLQAAPLAGFGDAAVLTRSPNTEDFLAMLLSH